MNQLNISLYCYYRVELLLILFFFLFVSNTHSQDKVYDSRTGVEIIFSAEGDIFPNSWYSNEINAKAVSLYLEEYERSEMLMKQVLLKYPTSILKLNLKTIYVLNYLEFYGISFGGTNSSDAVYLSNRGVNLGYTDLYLKQLFHAEFSSILLRNYKEHFDENNWESINPASFEYGNGGVDAIKEGLSDEEFNAYLNSIGFINEYATSSLENDFNSFAKNLFEPSEEFQELLTKNEPMRQKAELFKQFYEKIDSQFSQSFWIDFTLTKYNLLSEDVIKIYPNPAVDNLNINNLPINSRLLLTNSSGIILKSITTQSKYEQIYIGDLPKGLYIIHLDKNKSWKIIKN